MIKKLKETKENAKKNIDKILNLILKALLIAILISVLIFIWVDIEIGTKALSTATILAVVTSWVAIITERNGKDGKNE